MKRFFSIVLSTILFISLLLVGMVCVFSLVFVPSNPVLESLPDFTEKEVFSSDGFQDITVYAKYHYYAIAPTVLEGNEYFQPVTDADLSELLSYLEDFEKWVALDSTFPSKGYDFNKSTLNPGDFFYIQSRYAGTHPEHGSEDKFWNYDVYYFDLDTGILYYFHNNI